MAYDAETPPERQVQSWTCSIRTCTWMLQSVGCDVNAQEIQDIMVPEYATPEDGLLYGNGAGMAEVLADQSGMPTGYRWADWNWLVDHAGTMPIGLGSGTLYHWVAVRDYDPATDTILLMNPAPGYRGLGDVMTHWDYTHWAPWAATFILVDDAPPVAPGESEEEALMTAEQTRIAKDDVLRTIDEALAVPDLPDAAFTALLYGARPATETIIRLGGGDPDS